MWTFIGLDENQNYKLVHPYFGTMTVGAWSIENPSGANTESEAIIIAEGAFDNE